MTSDLGPAKVRPEQVEDAVKAINDLATAANDMAERLALAMQPVVDAIGKAQRALYVVAWHYYLAQGAPYGESHQGLMRWLEREAEHAAD